RVRRGFQFLLQPDGVPALSARHARSRGAGDPPGRTDGNPPSDLLRGRVSVRRLEAPGDSPGTDPRRFRARAFRSGAAALDPPPDRLALARPLSLQRLVQPSDPGKLPAGRVLRRGLLRAPASLSRSRRGPARAGPRPVPRG